MTDVSKLVQDHVLDDTFPCLGARKSVRSGSCDVRCYEHLTTDDASIRQLADALQSFVRRESEPRSAWSVLVAVEIAEEPATEAAFERYVWSVLGRLHAVDDADWDPLYSRTPEDSSFKFSFAGRAFYIVGMSPVASRLARRLPRPALVFNPVWQFERLREVNHLDGLIDHIRRRDVLLQGSINPNLLYEGELSDALQYSGRSVDAEWRCPVNFGGGTGAP